MCRRHSIALHFARTGQPMPRPPPCDPACDVCSGEVDLPQKSTPSNPRVRRTTSRSTVGKIGTAIGSTKKTPTTVNKVEAKTIPGRVIGKPVARRVPLFGGPLAVAIAEGDPRACRAAKVLSKQAVRRIDELAPTSASNLADLPGVGPAKARVVAPLVLHLYE